DVGRDRLLPVPREHAGEELFAAGERLVPTHLAPRRAVADERRPHAIGVVVQRAQHGALGTDEAAAPDVVVVGTHGDDAIAVDVDLETAHRFAERTGPEMGHGRHVADGSIRAPVCAAPWSAPGTARAHLLSKDR